MHKLAVLAFLAWTSFAPSPGDGGSVDGNIVVAGTNDTLQGVRVFLVPVDQPFTAATVAVLSDAAGHFQMDDVRPGRYNVTASASGWVPSVTDPRSLTE